MNKISIKYGTLHIGDATFRQPKAWRTAEQAADAIRAYAESIGERATIAQRHGLTRRTMTTMAKAAGYALARGGSRKTAEQQADEAETVRLIRKWLPRFDYDVEHLAVGLEMPPSTVRKYIEKHNISPA